MDSEAKARVQASMDEARRQLDIPPPGQGAERLSPVDEIIGEVTGGVRRHPALWLGGAALVGFALARALVGGRRTAKVIEIAPASRGPGWLTPGVRSAFQNARPQLEAFGKRMLAEFLQNRQNPAPHGAAPPAAAPESPAP